jgi:hypothetical protein
MGHLFGMNSQAEHFYTPTNEVKSDRVKDTYSKQSIFALLETQSVQEHSFSFAQATQHRVKQNLL